MSKFTMGYS